MLHLSREWAESDARHQCGLKRVCGRAALDKKVENDAAGEDLASSRCSYTQSIHRSFSATKSFGASFTGSFTGSFAHTTPLKTSLIDDANAAAESEEVHLSDIKNFGISFWLICLGCVVVYGCVLPFNNIASDFLRWRSSSPFTMAPQVS